MSKQNFLFSQLLFLGPNARDGFGHKLLVKSRAMPGRGDYTHRFFKAPQCWGRNRPKPFTKKLYGVALSVKDLPCAKSTPLQNTPIGQPPNSYCHDI